MKSQTDEQTFDSKENDDDDNNDNDDKSSSSSSSINSSRSWTKHLATVSAAHLAQCVCQMRCQENAETTVAFLRDAIASLDPNETKDSSSTAKGLDATSSLGATRTSESESLRLSNETTINGNVGSVKIVETQEQLERLDNNSNIDNEDAKKWRTNNQTLLIATTEVSCLQPRGKFDWSVGRDGFQLVDKKKNESLTVRANRSNKRTKNVTTTATTCDPRTVEHILFFPKPSDCQNKSNGGRKKDATTKNKTSDMVLLMLNNTNSSSDDNDVNNNNSSMDPSAVLYKGKPQTQICWQLPLTAPIWNNSKGNDTTAAAAAPGHDDDATMAWMRVLAQSLHVDVRNPRHVTRIFSTPPTPTKRDTAGFTYSFVSHSDPSVSTTGSALPFVSCYLGVQDGALFPTEAGLLFFKPPRFVPRTIMHAIGCTGTNRFLTLTVLLRQEEEDRTGGTQHQKKKSSSAAAAASVLEFTNIDKHQQQVLRSYIHGTLIPAMERDIATADQNDNEDGGANSRSNTNNNKDSSSSNGHWDKKDEPMYNGDDPDEDAPFEQTGSRRKRKAAMEAQAITKRAMQQQQQHANKRDDDEDDDGDEEFNLLASENDSHGVDESSSDDDDDEEGEDGQ